jgi:Rrf2 family protein
MTSRFTLAAHILGMLAWSERSRGRPVTSEEMARSINTNPVVVRRILSDLRRASLVDTKRGVGGGVTLARRADTITLRDAYEAIEEGEELFGRHPSGPNPCCQIGPLVAELMEEVYGRAEHALKESLQQMTIADMSSELELRFLTNLKPPVTDEAPRSSRTRVKKGATVSTLPTKTAPVRAPRRSVG